jgi:hypothetical protein
MREVHPRAERKGFEGSFVVVSDLLRCRHSPAEIQGVEGRGNNVTKTVCACVKSFRLTLVGASGNYNRGAF